MKRGQNTLYIVTPRKIEKYMNSGGTLFFYLALKVYTHTLKVFKGLEGLEGFKGLRAGKRQAWTPIRSH